MDTIDGGGAVKIQKRSGGRLTEAYLLSKYPHIIPGSLRWDDEAGKQTVTIRCTADGCDEERDVHTSDLFQVTMCVAHAKEARKARKTEAKAQKAAQAAQAKAEVAIA